MVGKEEQIQPLRTHCICLIALLAQVNVIQNVTSKVPFWSKATKSKSKIHILIHTSALGSNTLKYHSDRA